MKHCITRCISLLSLMLFLYEPVWASDVTVAKTVAPDFTLKSNSGENLRLSEAVGDVILLNFWASWCGPCRQEMPILNALHQRYESLGFQIWGVNVDEDINEAKKMLAAINVDFPVLFDSQSKVAKQYEVEAMPTTILIDRDGKQRFLHQGYLPGYGDLYEQQIKLLVKE